MAKECEWQGGLFPEEEPPVSKRPAPVLKLLHKSAPGRGEGEAASKDKTPEPQEEEARPLSDRMRPRTLEEYVGQEHLIGPGRVLRRLLEADFIPSLILWGPPGTGKTSLARLLTSYLKVSFVALSAVTAGVNEVRRVVGEAKERWRLLRRRTLLFLDEIHRFNKAQQDVILPHVEDGSIILVGATTENPSFQVIAPLLSRCRILTLKALTSEDIMLLLRRALEDSERGLGRLHVQASPQVLRALAQVSVGDARAALNTLEEAARALTPNAAGERILTEEAIAEALGRPNLRYDRAGESHYDIISALIKSVRGSDPDGALYWLARLLEAGEDPLFIARRLVILASEDVGLADPQALSVAVAAQQAAHFVGMPEGFYPLAEATLYLALAPKSNSVGLSYMAAVERVRQNPGEPVPLHLRNAPTKLMEELGYAKGYKYAHDYPEHYVPQQFLPDTLQGQRFYRPGQLGYEKRLAAWLEHLRSRDGERSQ